MVSIIIRTYNEEKYLKQLLRRISEQSYTDFEVILVDSGSTDKTLGIASKFSFVTIVNIKKEDFTFGYSLNQGIKKSKGDYCLMVSGHCLPKNVNWIESMILPFTDKKIGLVYGRQLGHKDSKFSEHQIFNSWYPPDSNYKQLTSFCNNANCCIRKSVWTKLKGYDEKVPGLEDILMADKILKETKMYIAYESLGTVFHMHNENWNQVKNRYYREAITYSSIHPSEKFTLQDFLKLTTINISHDIKQLFKQKKPIINTSISILFFRTNQFWGTYKGYKYTKKYNELRKRFYYPI